MDQNNFLELLESIDDWKDIEFEIRYLNITPDFIKNIIEDIKDNYSISQSISFIKRNGDNSNLINNIEFLPNNKTIKTNYNKKTLGFYIADQKKMTLSSEVKSEEKVPINGGNILVRYKIRLSYLSEGWSYDLTLIHNFVNTENESIYNEIKKKLYKENMDKNHLLKLVDNNLINKYEFEIEYKKKDKLSTIDFKELESKIPTLLEFNNYSLIIKQLSEILKKPFKTFKSFLPQAVTLTSLSYNYIYPPIGWYITHKTDGYRGLGYIKNNMIVIICSNYFKTYYCKDNICKRKNPENTEEEKDDSNYIIDCEIIDNNIYIFDLLVYQSNDLTGQDFNVRYQFMERLNTMLNNIDSELKFYVKYFRKISDDLQRSFKDIIDYNPGYTYDGYIMVDSINNYMLTKSYKIKEYNTIDFYLLKCPDIFLDKQEFIKKKGYILYILYLTITKLDASVYKIRPLDITLKMFQTNNSTTIPVHFNPNDHNHAYLYYSPHDLGNYTIAELNPKFDANGFVGWDFIKIREDKLYEPDYYGNYYKLGEEMWYANQNPLRIEDMHLPSDSYFSVKKDSIYFAQTAFNSFVKEQLILHNKNTRAICDLACGKGQDLGRYLKFGYNNIMLLEVDKNALAELIKRLPVTMSKNKNKDSVSKNNIKIVNTNLHNNHKDVIAKMRKITAIKNYSLVVCNFAIHYLTDTYEHMLNLALLINEIIDETGMFIYTTNNNQAIHNKFIELDSDDISLYENDILKYRIKKNYPGKILDENIYQMVDWKLLFNNNLISEPLMPHNKFNTMMKEYGFEVFKEGSFSDYIKYYNIKDLELSDIDKEYIGFYYYCILKRS